MVSTICGAPALRMSRYSGKIVRQKPEVGVNENLLLSSRCTLTFLQGIRKMNPFANNSAD